jgi:cell wall-associated NlpC family hydrolase
MITDPHLLTVSGWVGKNYEEMGTSMRGCWNLVRTAYALRGIGLPFDYHITLDQQMFRTVFELQPWDIVPICNHRLPIVTHVALYLGDSTIIHAIEDSGVVAHPISREPWWSRIARDEKGRRGYLRLRFDPDSDRRISPLAIRD